MSRKGILEDCATRVSYKSVAQECQAKVSHKGALQGRRRVSPQNVHQECISRVSSRYSKSVKKGFVRIRVRVRGFHVFCLL